MFEIILKITIMFKIYLNRYQNEFGNLIRERKPFHLVKDDLIKLMKWKLTVSYVIQILFDLYFLFTTNISQ